MRKVQPCQDIYYLSNIDKLKKNNNAYLLSYQQGIKILEQVCIEDIKEINDNLKLVSLNGNKKARACVCELPSERVLAETDAPFQFLKGEQYTDLKDIIKVNDEIIKLSHGF